MVNIMGIIFQLRSVLSGPKEQIQKCFIENKTQTAWAKPHGENGMFWLLFKNEEELLYATFQIKTLGLKVLQPK